MLDELENIEGLCLASIKQSAFKKKNMQDIRSFLVAFFKVRDLSLFLIVRIFGRDEMWTVMSYKNRGSIKRIKDEPFVSYTAMLTESLPRNKKIIGEIIERSLPVAYLFLRTDSLKLKQLEKITNDSGGMSFLLGILDHPHGYNNFVAITVKTGHIDQLNEVIHKIAELTDCEKWECALGADHWWLTDTAGGKPVEEKDLDSGELADKIWEFMISFKCGG